MNGITFSEIQKLIVNIFHCGIIAFTASKHPDFSDLMYFIVQSVYPDDDHCEVIIPIVKGPHMT